MKANELFIGAHVEVFGKNRKIKSIVTKDTGVEVSFYGSNPVIVSLDMLQPIPLTPEILEKNGFKSWKYGYMWKERIGMGGQTTSATSPIEIIVYEGGHSVIMNPHDGKDFQGSIDNVHELQHALKLCGISKEIAV